MRKNLARGVGRDAASVSESRGSAAYKNVSALTFEDDGTIPNNQKFPVLIYKDAFRGRTDRINQIFAENNWGNNWVNGVFSFHHFHSNAHEVLGIRAGSGEVLLGGPKGRTVRVSAGDVLVLPAGTGHKKISSDCDFTVIGGYPNGQFYDTEIRETPELKANIAKVGKPDQDPVYGDQGPLFDLWNE